MLSATCRILDNAPSFHFKNPPARPECRTEDFATPYTRRQGLLSFKAPCSSNSEAASATFGCSRTSPAQRLVPHAGRCASYCREIPIPPPRENVERSWLRGPAPPNFNIEFRTHAPSEFRHSALRGKHAAQKEQITSVHCFRIGSDRIGSKLRHHTRPVEANTQKVSELRFVLFGAALRGAARPGSSLFAPSPRLSYFNGCSRLPDARQTETVVHLPVVALGHGASPETKC